jgi:hypothetical protein|tara:strand:- start:1717 stop:2070 length:354 start_codon:yes stop_codon:yes gene_type:complete
MDETKQCNLKDTCDKEFLTYINSGEFLEKVAEHKSPSPATIKMIDELKHGLKEKVNWKVLSLLVSILILLLGAMFGLLWSELTEVRRDMLEFRKDFSVTNQAVSRIEGILNAADISQ